MMKRNSLILLLVIVFTGAMQAQGWVQTPFDIYVTTGPAIIHNKSYKQFYKSFNEFNGPLMKNPLSGFGMSNATTWGVALDPDNEDPDLNEGTGFDLAIFGTRIHGKDKTIYDVTKEQRVFDITRRNVGIEAGLGPKSETMALTFGSGLMWGHTILRSYFVYPDGTESYGKEQVWNGIYGHWDLSTFLYTKFVYRLNHFKLLARLGYSVDIFAASSYLEDTNFPRYMDLGTGIQYPDRLPTDVVGWYPLMTTNNIPDYDGGWVKNHLANLSLQFGISIPIAIPE